LHVCHACDNPPCVNPDHLWLGTNADNVRDAREKGRPRVIPRITGVAHHAAKLNPEKVAEIRRLQGIVGPKELGRRYGVSHGAIQHIFQGKTWRNS
jgi:hypothetical protein